MEVLQREHIRQNLSALISNTDCNVSFISHLVSKNVLGEYDVESLRVIEHRYEKAAKFYEIVVEIADSYNVIREAFQETCQTGAEAIFNQLASSPVASCSSSLKAVHPDLESRTRKRIRYEVRSPVHLFTGRDEEISLLHESMTCQKGETKSSTFVPNITTVTGLGGIGKTELCRKYIEVFSEYYDGNVVWIQADRESDLTRDFRILARDHLKISLKNMDGSVKDIKTVVDEVYKYFIGKRALFVLDNAVRSEEEYLDIFMPTRVTTKPAIIITSRDRDFMEMSSNTIAIGEMKELDAVSFVKNGLKIESSSQDKVIQKLVKRLQYFPLAIQQAVSLIKQRDNLRTFEIEEYLSLFETNKKHLLKTKCRASTLPTNSYSLTTYTTWKITTDLIAPEEEFGQLAIKYLNRMAYFEPDRIPIELFSKYNEIPKQTVEIETALQLLVKFSMINSQPSEAMLSIHRLVQEVIRIELKSEKIDEEVLKECLSIFKFEAEEEKIVGYNSVNHAKSVLEFSISRPPLLKEFSLVPFNVGQTLLLLMSDKESHEFCMKWHNILTENLPEGHVAIIHIDFLIAQKLYKSEKYEESLEAFYLVLAKYSSIQSNKNHEFMIWQTKRYFADTLMSLAQFEESLELSKTVVSEQSETPRRKTNELANCALIAFENYLNLGNLKGALSWCDTIINSFYPDELQSIHKESQDLKEDKGSSRYLEEIGNKVTKMMELDKIWIDFGVHLADYLRDVQGENEGSLQIAVKTYELTRKYYGKEHIKTQNGLLKIANLNCRIGNYAEAVSIFKKPELAKIFEQPGHIPPMWRIMLFELNNAIALSGAGAHEEALEKHFKIFDSLVELYGTDNEYLFTVLISIATVYVDMNKLEEALEVSLEAAKLAEKVESIDPDLIKNNFDVIDALRLELNCNPERMNEWSNFIVKAFKQFKNKFL